MNFTFPLAAAFVSDRQSAHLQHLVQPAPVEDDPQKIYDPIPMTEDVFNLNRNDLQIDEKLGMFVNMVLLLSFLQCC